MEHLLNPISDEQRCGEYLKGNRSLYRGLRNSFNMAQSSFRQLIESPDAMQNEELLNANADNWSALKEQCEDTLQNTSKDVEVFCWLATAQLFGADPLNNLAQVLETFTQAVDQYWSDLNPKPPVEKLKASDEAGQRLEWTEHRTKPLLQLIGDTQDSGLLYMPLQLTGLIGDIDYSRYFSAERSGELAGLKEEALQALSTGKDEAVENILALGRCQDALVTLEQRIGEHCQQDGAQGISFRFAKEIVERLIQAMKYLLGEQLQPWPLDKVEEPSVVEAETSGAESTAVAEENSAVASTTEGNSNPVSDPSVSAVAAANPVAYVPGEIVSRDQAFQELRRIADFMRRTEPHSPVYMLLERAIRWGYMSLPELLNEMVGDNSQVMGRITQLAGLETTEQTTIPDVPVSAAAVMAPAIQPVTGHPVTTAPASTDGQQMNIPDDTSGQNNVQSNSSSTEDNGNSGSSSSSGISDFEW